MEKAEEIEMETELSNLPDEILVHILSYIDTRDAVRFSVVSRRWRHLWRGLTVLNIDSDSFHCYSSFSTFIHSLLASHSSSSSSSSSLPLSLCSFSFDISNPIYTSLDAHHDFESLLSLLIHYVIDHGAHHLTLLFPRIIDDLPLLFCSSPPLSSLHLHQLVIPPESFALGFASLTILHLVKCSFIIHNQDIFDPFKDFVHLTDLSICNCRIPSEVRVLIISAPQLTNLTISDMEHQRNWSPHCMIVLSTMNLVSFKFTGSHFLNISAPPLPLIGSVYLDVAMIYHLFGSNPLLVTARTKFISELIDMFQIFADATTVTLSFQTIRILAMFPDALQLPSPLTGLKFLKLKFPREASSFTIPADIISFLLNGSPAAVFKVELCEASIDQELGRELSAGFPKF